MNGNLYGTAEGAEAYARCGTLFEATPSGQVTTLYQFKGGSDGCGPASSLLYLSGTFYGTTEVGGKYNDGTVYAVTP